MIVQAPDNKTIDFGSLPPDQVQSAMQRLYPPSNQQQAGNPPSQGEQPAPANSNNLGNNQNDLLHSISAWANSPTNVDTSDLPQSGQGLNFAQKLGFGAQALGRGALGVGEDMVAKPMARGITELLQGAGGEMRAATDNPLDPQRGNLSTDALTTLGMLSPSSIALQSKMAPFNSGQQVPEPIGNQLIKFGDNLKPGEMGNVEDAAFNQLMTPEVGAQPGSALKAGFGARSPEEYQDAASAVSGAANPIWKQMREAGDALKPDASNGLMDNITQNLSSPENKYIPQLNPKTTAIIEDMKTEAENGSLGVSTLDQYRRMLSRVGGSEDGFSAGVAKRTIDKYLAEIPDDALISGNKDSIDLLNQARAQSAAGFKAQDVADLLSKANGDPNKIKSVLTKFVSDDDNLIGMNQQQKDALRFAANTGIVENVLKAFGKFGLDFSKSGVGNTALPALATMAGHAPLAIVGTLARQGQKYIARGKAEQAFRLFEKGGQQ